MSTQTSDNETELRSLMTSVMSAPLEPLLAKMNSTDERIAKLEGTTAENRIAISQVNEAVHATLADLRKRLGTLLEDLNEGLDERVNLLTGQLDKLNQQQDFVLVTLDAAGSEASKRSDALRAAMAACDDGVHVSLTRLDDLHSTMATTDAQHVATLDASLDHLRELRAAAEAATTHHGAALSALQTGQARATAAQVRQDVHSKEIALTQLVQQAAQEDAALALPALLAGLRADLDATHSNQVDAARASILSGTDTQGAERQQGVLAQLKLLKTLTLVNLLALAGIAGLTIFQFIERS